MSSVGRSFDLKATNLHSTWVAAERDYAHAVRTGADDGICGSLQEDVRRKKRAYDDYVLFGDRLYNDTPLTVLPTERDGDYEDRAKEISDAALGLHLQKAADYADTGDHLGSAGQYAELWRKIGKLKGPMWDRIPLSSASEPPIEILQDLIGHCIKAIDYLERAE